MAPKSAFIHVWPAGFLVLGSALTVTWIGLLGYGAVALTELAFGDYAPVTEASPAVAVKRTAPDVRHNIQATNIMDGSQATIIPCKTSGMAAIVGAPKTTHFGRYAQSSERLSAVSQPVTVPAAEQERAGLHHSAACAPRAPCRRCWCAIAARLQQTALSSAMPSRRRFPLGCL